MGQVIVSHHDTVKLPGHSSDAFEPHLKTSQSYCMTHDMMTCFEQSALMSKLTRQARKIRNPMFLRTSSSAVALLILAISTSAVVADERLNVRYDASLTGIQVGKAAFTVDIADHGYTASGTAEVAGLAKLVTRGHGSTISKGTFVDGKVYPFIYSAASESDKKSEEIRMKLSNNSVEEFSVLPPQEFSSKRIPVTEDDRTDVVDPMSAAIITVPDAANMLAKENCNRTIAIFDGKQRYNLIFSYDRIEQMKDVKGYSGPTLVCRVDYKAVSGHQPNRIQVKFMEDNKTIFVWLAPVTNTRVLFPIRVSFLTMIGVVVVQAENFVTSPLEKQAANPAVK